MHDKRKSDSYSKFTQDEGHVGIQHQIILFNTKEAPNSPVSGKWENVSVAGTEDSINDDILQQNLELKYRDSNVKLHHFTSVQGIPPSASKCPLLRTCKRFAILYDDDNDDICAIIPKMTLGSSSLDPLSKINTPDDLLCVCFSKSTPTEDLLVMIKDQIYTGSAFHLFYNSKKLLVDKKCLDNIHCTHAIFILPLKERRKHFKILYSVDHNRDEILHVHCNATDCVQEVKEKFLSSFSHLKGTSKDQCEVFFSRPFSNAVLADDDAIVKTLYTSTFRGNKDGYSLVSGSESEEEDLFRIVDLVVHIGPVGSIHTVVKYSKTHSRAQKDIRKAKFVLVDKNGSTESLRNQIGKVLHQDPLSLRLSVGSKDIPELQTLQNFRELKGSCVIFARVKPKVSLTVQADNESYDMEVQVMQKISNIKNDLAKRQTKPSKLFELCLAGMVLNGQCTINDYNIESGTVLQLISHEKRIELHIKNMVDQSIAPGSVKPKIETLSIDDPSTTTISSLKDSLCHMLMLSKSALRLSVRGSDLTDGSTIKESVLKDGDTILLTSVSPTEKANSEKELVVGQSADTLSSASRHNRDSESLTRLSEASGEEQFESETDDLVHDNASMVCS